MSYRDLRDRIETTSDARHDFCTLEDGYVYFFPRRIVGALSAVDLRILADILDDRNAVWAKQVQDCIKEST